MADIPTYCATIQTFFISHTVEKQKRPLDSLHEVKGENKVVEILDFCKGRISLNDFWVYPKVAKGQLISKAIYGLLTYPKK